MRPSTFLPVFSVFFWGPSTLMPNHRNFRRRWCPFGTRATVWLTSPSVPTAATWPWRMRIDRCVCTGPLAAVFQVFFYDRFHEIGRCGRVLKSIEEYWRVLKSIEEYWEYWRVLKSIMKLTLQVLDYALECCAIFFCCLVQMPTVFSCVSQVCSPSQRQEFPHGMDVLREAQVALAPHRGALLRSARAGEAAKTLFRGRRSTTCGVQCEKFRIRRPAGGNEAKMSLLFLGQARCVFFFLNKTANG